MRKEISFFLADKIVNMPLHTKKNLLLKRKRKKKKRTFFFPDKKSGECFKPFLGVLIFLLIIS